MWYRKQRDILMIEISSKNKEIATFKKAKQHLMEISKKLPVVSWKNDTSSDEMFL